MVLYAPAPGTACFELSGDLEWLHTAAAHAKHVIEHHVNQGQVRMVRMCAGLHVQGGGRLDSQLAANITSDRV